MVRQKLRGFVGQGVVAKKSYGDALLQLVSMPVYAVSGSGVVTAPRPCIAVIFGWGAGGSGGAGSGGGGGGGAAVAYRMRLSRGQGISYSVGIPGVGVPDLTDGNDGTDTVLSTPAGTLRAGGGRAGLWANAGGGLGGQASGIGTLRPGARGGDQPSPFGGSGGSFPEIGATFAGIGDGSSGVTGGGASSNGGAGRVIVLLLRAS